MKRGRTSIMAWEGGEGGKENNKFNSGVSSHYPPRTTREQHVNSLVSRRGADDFFRAREGENGLLSERREPDKGQFCLHGQEANLYFRNGPSFN